MINKKIAIKVIVLTICLFQQNLSANILDCAISEEKFLETQILNKANKNTVISEIAIGYTIINDASGVKLYLSYKYDSLYSGGRLPVLLDQTLVGQNLYDSKCQLIYEGRPVAVK